MGKQFICIFCGNKADFLKQNGNVVALCRHCNREIDILGKREFYRVETDIPCACSKPWADGTVGKISMKIVDLSQGGLKLESDGSKKTLRNAVFFRSPFVVDFYLGENEKFHIKKTLHPMHLTKTQVGAEFDDSEREDYTISSYLSYLLGQS